MKYMASGAGITLSLSFLYRFTAFWRGRSHAVGGGGNKHLEKKNGFAQNALKRIESTVGVGEIIDSSMHDSL